MVDPAREQAVIEIFLAKSGEEASLLAGPRDLSGDGARDGMVQYAGEPRFVEIFSIFAQRDIRRHMQHARTLDDRLATEVDGAELGGWVSVHVYDLPVPPFSDEELREVVAIAAAHEGDESLVYPYLVGGNRIGINKMEYDNDRLTVSIPSGNDLDCQLHLQISNKNDKVADHPGAILLIDKADVQLLSIFDVARVWQDHLANIRHGNFHSVWVVSDSSVAPLKIGEWIYDGSMDSFNRFKACALGMHPPTFR